MNRLARFLAGTNKWMANDPLFSTAQRLVFTLASCCQVDHFDFRVPHFASGKQLPVRVGPNESGSELAHLSASATDTRAIPRRVVPTDQTS
jgi:hypothetical protein